MDGVQEMTYFKIQTDFDCDVWTDYAEFCSNRYPFFFLFKIAGLMGVVLAAISWYALADSMREAWFGVYAAGMVAVGIGVFVLPYVWSFFSYRRQLEKAAAPTFVFCEEGFYLEGISHACIGYARLTACYETERYFYVYQGEDTVYMLKKSGFREGEAHCFREFIEEAARLSVMTLRMRRRLSIKVRWGLALLGVSASVQGAVWYLGFLDRHNIRLETDAIMGAAQWGVSIMAGALCACAHALDGMFAKRLIVVLMVLFFVVLFARTFLSQEARLLNLWLWV